MQFGGDPLFELLLLTRLGHFFLSLPPENTAQKMKFSIQDFLCRCEQIRRKLRIWSHLLKKYLTENFNFCTVKHQNIRGFLMLLTSKKKSLFWIPVVNVNKYTRNSEFLQIY